MSTPARLATYFHIHLVSDSTGETLNALARAVCARFENVLPIEHIYALVRSTRQLERALSDIQEAPGVVLSIRWCRPCHAISARRSPGAWASSTPSTPTILTAWTP
jgi:hypothetical protein